MPLKEVILIVPVIGLGVELVVTKAGILPVPLATKPIEGLLLVHE